MNKPKNFWPVTWRTASVVKTVPQKPRNILYALLTFPTPSGKVITIPARDAKTSISLWIPYKTFISKRS